MCSTGSGGPFRVVLEIRAADPLRIAAGVPASLRCSDSGSPTPRATFRNLGILSGYASSQAKRPLGRWKLWSRERARRRPAIARRFAGPRSKACRAWDSLPAAASSRATGVSADGAVIVGDADANAGSPPTSSAGFRWTAADGNAAHPRAARFGAVLRSRRFRRWHRRGGYLPAIRQHGVSLDRATGPVALSRLGPGSNAQSTASAISRDGSVIAGAGHPVLTGAAIWLADGSATILGKLPGDVEGIATAASSDGSVVTGVSTGTTGTPHAFRWTQQGGMVDLDSGPGGLPGMVATSISDNGRVIVGWYASSSGDVALIWDADHGWRALDAVLALDFGTQVPGWTLSRATAVSGDGRAIAGFGTNPQGQTEAWVVILPE